MPLKQEGVAHYVACPAGPGMFTGAVLKVYGGLYLTLQAYRDLLRIRWEGSRLCKAPDQSGVGGQGENLEVDRPRRLVGDRTGGRYLPQTVTHDLLREGANEQLYGG